MAGVRKMIYSSHTQTDVNSPLDYIRGKAEVAEYLKQSGLEYGIVKPCAIYGDTPQESIVINNICYFMRTFPIFPMPGDSNTYHLQPVHVRDMSELMVDAALDDSKAQYEVDAVGELYTVHELLTNVKNILGLNRYILNHVPLDLCYYGSKPIDFIF